MNDENVYYYYGGEVEETITKVVIAAGVTKIDDNAFDGCWKLQSVEFEEPHQVKKIGEEAFRDCHALNKIELPESLLKIGTDAFKRCHALRRVVIPGGVTSIGRYAFGDSGIEEIVISDGIESIPEEALSLCERLHTVRLPASLKEIHWRAFCSCPKLENVIVPADGLPLLKMLDLQGIYQSRGWEEVCKIARKAPNLTRLSLSWVTAGPGDRYLDDGDIPLVIEMVSSCPHLELLTLSLNSFSDQAIRTLDSKGILGRLRHVYFRDNSDTRNTLSAKEFLNLLQRNPRLAIFTSHKWVNPKDERLIRHYLDMNRYGCRGVPIRNVSLWPRLIDQLGRIDDLETCPANVLYHLLREQNDDLCLYYQQNRTKQHHDWKERIDSLKATIGPFGIVVVGIVVATLLSSLHKK